MFSLLGGFESTFVSTGAIARPRAYFGRGTGAILLDNMVCTGKETKLVNCRSNPLGVHNCNHSEDAGVICQGIESYYFYKISHCTKSVIVLCNPFNKIKHTYTQTFRIVV